MGSIRIPRLFSISLLLGVRGLAAPYIDPLTLTALAPAQESALFMAEQSWSISWGDKVYTEPLWSAYASMYDSSNSVMSVADEQANNMMADHVQTAGADDRLRSVIMTLPPTMQDYWKSVMDDRNGAFATALNNLQDPSATPTLPTKRFAVSVSVPTQTDVAAATTTVNNAASSTSTFSSTETAVDSSKSQVSSGSSLSTVSKVVPAVVGILLIKAAIWMVVWARHANKKKRDMERLDIDTDAMERLKSLETENFLFAGRKRAQLAGKAELDAGEDGVPARQKVARRTELDAGADGVPLTRSESRTPRGSEDDNDAYDMMSGAINNDNARWPLNTREGNMGETAFELPATTSRNGSPTHIIEFYGR